VNETDLQRLYARVLARSKNIPRSGRLQEPQASVTMVSPLCGSQVTVDLRVRDGRVIDYAQKVRACTLGAAAASIVGEHVVGHHADELRALRDTMRRMLKDDGPPPDGEWADLALLEPARDLVSRHGSIMLALDAVAEALDEVEGREAPSPGGGKGIPDTMRA